MNDELRERLAAYAHDAWAGWMKYQFEQGGCEMIRLFENTTQEVWVMSPSSYTRWQRQMNTPYADLPESEKDSDRVEASKILKAVTEGILKDFYYKVCQYTKTTNTENAARVVRTAMRRVLSEMGIETTKP